MIVIFDKRVWMIIKGTPIERNMGCKFMRLSFIVTFDKKDNWGIN